jgi:hypothetical protein
LLQLCKILKKNNQKRIFHKLMWEANYGCYAIILDDDHLARTM